MRRLRDAWREARIGWHQGGVIRNVRRLDRLDPGWQSRAYTRRLLGIDPLSGPPAR